MKVLIVVPSFHNGGTITSLKNILARIDRKQCCVDVFPITNSGPNYEVVKQYANVIGTNIDGGTNRKSIKALIKSKLFILVKSIKKILCKIGYDPSIILFKRVIPSLQNNGYDEIIAFQEGQATRFVSLFKCVRKVAWVRCDYSTIDGKSQKKDRDLHVYDSYDQIICVSKYTKERFIETVSHVESKTIAIHNLIPTERIIKLASMEADNHAFQECDKLKFVSLGRLHPIKQFSKIPEIAYSLRKKGLAFCWFIIGADESDTDNIRERIFDYRVDDCVKLLGNKNNPYPYIRQSDLLVCTSLSEACPNVINEAKILGTPVVTTNFGSAKELLISGKQGIATTIDKIGDAMYLLLVDDNKYSRIKKELDHYVYDNKGIQCELERFTSLRFID